MKRHSMHRFPAYRFPAHRFPAHRYLVLRWLVTVGVVLLGGAFALPQGNDFPPGDEPPKSGIRFKLIAGDENGSKEILDKRQAEVVEKKGAKLVSHDWWLWGLTGIDYDRDGDPDFLVTIHGAGANGVLLKNQFKETGKLGFVNVNRELGVDWQLPAAIGRRTFVWDFDGDGWLDFNGVRSPDFLNQAGKKFVPTDKNSFGSFNPQAIVDLNGDGHPDAYHASGYNASGYNGLWNPTTKTFDIEPYTHPLKDKIPESVRQLWEDGQGKERNRFLRVNFLTDHDLDGDGRPEIIVTGYGGYGGDAFGRYLRTDGEGRLIDATKEFGLPESGTPILLKDLDGDGHLDVLTAATAESGFFRNDGRGGFRLQPGPLTDLLRSRDPYLHRPDTADFDNDGLLDLIVSKPRHGPKVIFANLGEGKFEVLHKAQGWDSDPVVVCDLNDDGLLDVAIGGPANQVTLYLNTTPAPGNACRLYARLPAPNPYAVGTRVEVFRPGVLGQADSRPVLIEHAHPDATPIHIALGREKRFDIRVTFPGKTPLELKNVEAIERLQVTPDGKLTPVPAADP